MYRLKLRLERQQKEQELQESILKETCKSEEELAKE